jgi:sortase A
VRWFSSIPFVTTLAGIFLQPFKIDSHVALACRTEAFPQTGRNWQNATQASAKSRATDRRIARRIEHALLAAGLMLLAIYSTVRIESIISSRAALRKFAARVSSASADSLPTNGKNNSVPGIDFSLWDERRVQAYNESLRKDFGATLAVLKIPKIQLEAPVLDGTDDLTLNRGLGRISGTARPGARGNIGIAGHRDGFFRGLKDVGVGDTIELKTLNGTATYVVDQIKIVAPDDVSVLRAKSVPSVTLVTCYPFYFIGSAPQRYIVEASLTETQPIH